MDNEGKDPVDLEIADKVDALSRSVKRSHWKKCPDSPLGQVVERKLEGRILNAGKGKTARKATRDFVKTLEIRFEQVGPNEWTATPIDHPAFVVNAESKLRAVEKLQHIMTVAKRNELGANIRVQIDGKFISPTLEK